MLKNFKMFNESNQSNEDIDLICKKYNIINYTINDDGSIDVNDDVNLTSRSLIKLPLKFRNVIGNFHCTFNKLTTLEGAPKSVGDNFFCSNNELKSLEGAPKSVGTNFYCNYNPIYKWWTMIDRENNEDIEAFLDFNIHCDDPDEINQEKIDMINNG